MRFFKAILNWAQNLFFKAKKVPVLGPAIPSYYRKAMSELGVLEYPGKLDNPKVISYHAATTLKATHDSVPWCASFVCWCLEQSGIVSTRSARARSFLTWGESCEKHEGAIVVFKRGSNPAQGHVAFFVKDTEDWIYCLGGNQGNRVCIQKYAKSNLLDYRKPIS